MGFDVILCFLLAAVVMKMWATYRVDREYAKQGKDSPRYKMKMARFKAGQSAEAPKRLGARGYIRELWNDIWDDATERRKRHRGEKKAGTRPRPWERIKRGWRWANRPWGEKDDAPSGEDQKSPRPDADSQPGSDDAPMWTCSECGARLDGPGPCPNCGHQHGEPPQDAPQPQVQPDGNAQPQPVPDPLPCATCGATTIGGQCVDPQCASHAWNQPTAVRDATPGYQPRHGSTDQSGAQASPAKLPCRTCGIGTIKPSITDGMPGWCTNPDCPSNKKTDKEGKSMSELDYEQASADIQRAQESLTRMHDRADSLKQHVTAAGSDADALDAERVTLGAAMDQYTAALDQQSVDQETVGHASAVADALGPDNIRALIEHLDAAQQAVEAMLAAIDSAAASATATGESLTAKYADIVDRMAQTGVKGSFVEKS